MKNIKEKKTQNKKEKIEKRRRKINITGEEFNMVEK
jgi:hypothetical protein